VEATLLRAARGRPIEVICLESRPLNEGRRLAAELARGGAQVTLAVDAAAESLVSGCGAVLLGADSIGDAGVVNKIGSAAAARAGVFHRVPVFVVTDSSKLLPPGFPQCVDDNRPADQIWPDPGPVGVWNRYFEVVPGELITQVVLEDGQLTPLEVDRRRRNLTVPERIAEWAASRGDHPGRA
jgi:translation initiation factor eIF-2B subunit delta